MPNNINTTIPTNPDIYTIWETVIKNGKETKTIHSQYTDYMGAICVSDALREENPEREYELTVDCDVNRWTVLRENEWMWCVEIKYHPYHVHDWQYGNVKQYLKKVVNLGDGPEYNGDDFYTNDPLYPGLFTVDKIVAEFYDDAKDVAFRLFNKYVKEKAKELADAVDNANNFMFTNGML